MTTDAPGPADQPAEPETAATAHPRPEAPPANPFVPTYREPWINPAKRMSAIVLGVAGAVVLLALGFLVGLGLGGGHGLGHGELRDRPGAGQFVPYRHGYYAPLPRGRYDRGPGGFGPGRPAPPITSPVPSASTSSHR